MRAYQQQALARADPLAANLGTIVGDLMSFAHGLALLVQTQLTQGAVSEERRQHDWTSSRQAGAGVAGGRPARPLHACHSPPWFFTLVPVVSSGSMEAIC